VKKGKRIRPNEELRRKNSNYVNIEPGEKPQCISMLKRSNQRKLNSMVRKTRDINILCLIPNADQEVEKYFSEQKEFQK
jgi:hypothetical protein